MAGFVMNEICRAAPYFMLALLTVACSPTAGAPTSAELNQAPLAGAKIGGRFALIDQDGKRTSDSRFAGHYRIVYFGYTFCPDVCPVDVQKLAMGMRALEKIDPGLARRVVPIFITVDPERDTPSVLKQFVRAFHPRMVGLTGSPVEIAAVARAFAIFYQKGPVRADGGYVVDHSRQAYLFDPEGKPLALLSQEGSPEMIAAEIRRWAR